MTSSYPMLWLSLLYYNVITSNFFCSDMTFNLFIIFVIIIITWFFDRVEINFKKWKCNRNPSPSPILSLYYDNISISVFTTLLILSCTITIYKQGIFLCIHFVASYMNFTTTLKSCIFYFIQIQLNEHHLLWVMQTYFICLLWFIQCKRMIVESNEKKMKKLTFAK